MAADPKPGMIARTRGPLSVKNHAFAVCTRATPDSTIHSEPWRLLIYPPPRRASRLFSCPRPDPMGQDVSYVQLKHVPARLLHKKPIIPLGARAPHPRSWPYRTGSGLLSRRRELLTYGVLRSRMARIWHG